MRKLSLTLAAAGLTVSLGAFAAIPTDAAPFQLVVPCLKSGLNVTLEGLLLQPTNSDLDFASTSGSAAAFIPAGDDFDDGFGIAFLDDARAQSVNPRYRFGFRVGLGYTFPDSGNDVQLSWTRFGAHTDTDSFDLAPGAAMVSRFGVPFVTIPNFTLLDGFIEGDAFAAARSEVRTELNAIDLDVGQFVDIGTRLRMRMFAGLRYADVRSDMTNDFAQLVNANAFLAIDDVVLVDTDATLVVAAREQLNSRFRGLGPRFGVESSYHISDCFGFTGRAGVGVLAGRTEASSNFNVDALLTIVDELEDETTSFFLDVDQNVGSRNSNRLVPVLDARLGLNYSWIFENQSMLTIEAGYQATQYIDAVDRLDVSYGIPLIVDEEIFVPTSVKRTTSSIGFAGPYLSLDWRV